MATFDIGAGGLDAVNTILAEEANRIGSDIYKRTVHTSPWIDLVKQSAFPDGMGYQLTTMVYDRAIPTKDAAGGVEGVEWTTLGNINTDANNFNASDLGQPLKDATNDVQGARSSGGSGDRRSHIQFSKQLKEYSIKRAVIESPRISLEDLRFAAHRQEQLRAIMDLMTEATRYSWENRYRDEFERLADNTVQCKTAGSTFLTGDEGDTVSVALGDVDTNDDNTAEDASVATGNISNAVLDKVYFQLVRKGAGGNAYGRENGRPVFGLVLSSEASYALQTEAEFRDDIRYNNAVVSDLIAPLGIEKSFRGFYHLVDDLAPRFSATVDANDKLVRVEPYSVASGITTVNADYESAPYEVAFVIHPEVMESQIPNPFGGAGGVTFDPINYRGKFDWKNILSEASNPDGSIGFFRGVLASASKPIKTDCGYAIIYKRGAAVAT